MKYIKSFETTAELNAYIAEAENNYYLLEDRSKTDENSLTYIERQTAFTGLKFTSLQDGSTIMLHHQGSDYITKTFKKSTTGTSGWSNFDLETPITLNEGETLCVKADVLIAQATNNYINFDTTGAWKVSGDISSIVSDSIGLQRYEFIRLFGVNINSGHTAIVDASELILPFDTLAYYCYQNMFDGCTSLTTAPELPATTLASGCYMYMFNGCTSLTTAPELPATTLEGGCYYFMFNGCSNLSEIKIYATSWTIQNDWVKGVAESGTFYNYGGITDLTIGTNAAPYGWDYKGVDVQEITAIEQNIKAAIGSTIRMADLITCTPIVSDLSNVSYTTNNTSVVSFENGIATIVGTGEATIYATLGATTLSTTLTAYTTLEYQKVDFADLAVGDEILVTQYFGKEGIEKYGALILNKTSSTQSVAAMKCIDVGVLGNTIPHISATNDKYSKFNVVDYGDGEHLTIQDKVYNYKPYGASIGNTLQFSDGTDSTYTILESISVDTDTSSSGYGYMKRNVGNKYFAASAYQSIPTTFTWNQTSISGNYANQNVQFYKLVSIA